MRQLIVMRVNVAPGREQEFEELVAQRVRKHQARPEFERMYLLRTIAGSEFRLVSWWQGIQDAEAWVRKEVYALSEDPAHVGIVVGPVPHEVLDVVRHFEGAGRPVDARVGNA